MRQEVCRVGLGGLGRLGAPQGSQPANGCGRRASLESTVLTRGRPSITAQGERGERHLVPCVFLPRARRSGHALELLLQAHTDRLREHPPTPPAPPLSCGSWALGRLEVAPLNSINGRRKWVRARGAGVALR